MNKGIIILGSAASGKSHFEEQLYNYLYNKRNRHEFRVNPDYYVEDEESEYYNNPLRAYNYVYKTILPEIIDLNGNFILQNTGANTKTLRKIIDTPNYQFKAVMVYCNPIIAFIRNFSRERKLPKQVLLENWLKVYSQIEEYQDIFGKDNIYIYETEYTEDELFTLYRYQTGRMNIKDGLLKMDVESSFKKESTIYTPEQIKIKEQKFKEILEKVSNRLFELEDENNYLAPMGVNIEYIKEELNKWIT